MNKKAFTLVELLAVIAILAILVIIAIPNIVKLFNNAKVSTFKTEVQSIFKQAEVDFMMDHFGDAGPRYYCSGSRSGKNGTSKEECKNIKMTTNKDYYLELDSNGRVTCIGVKDNSYVYSSITARKTTDIIEDDIKDTSTVNIDIESCSG